MENKRKQRGLGQAVAPTTWGADWYYFGAADHWHHALYPCPCYILEVSVVTISILIWTYAGVVSGMVHTGVEVHRMDSEMSGLMERPWLQLMCCTICLPHGCNFRWRRESLSGSEYWLVCRRWTPEIEFNKRLSSSIIRLANYSVTTSLIYKLII